MNSLPILFNGEMVRAEREGRKTQTRRPWKTQPPVEFLEGDVSPITDGNGRWALSKCLHPGTRKGIAWPADPLPGIKSPFGAPGDQLWVRETWAPIPEERPSGYTSDPNWMGRNAWYRSDNDKPTWGGKWRSSIHMPRWASRTNLRVLRVWVERVQDITVGDIIAEGIQLEVPKGCEASKQSFPDDFNEWSDARKDEWFNGTARAMYFARCRDAQNHIDAFSKLWDSLYAKKGFGWDDNPHVFACEFERVSS